MSTNPTSPRRWFRFRLRTLLIAVAVLAVPSAWVANQVHWIRQRQAVRQHSPPLPLHTMRSCFPKQAPSWLWLFREEGEWTIYWRPDSPYTKAHAMRLFPEARLVELP